jgi:hypothetical protein
MFNPWFTFFSLFLFIEKHIQNYDITILGFVCLLGVGWGFLFVLCFKNKAGKDKGRLETNSATKGS